MQLTKTRPRDFDDASLYITRDNPNFKWMTETLDFRAAEKWALVANQPAITCTHIDAGGYATVIEIWHGMKKWYIGSDLMIPTETQGFDNTSTTWEPVTLRPGDLL